MPDITPCRLARLTPDASCDVIDAIAAETGAFSAAGIDRNAGRLCHFFAQAAHESAGLTRLVENLNYRASRLRAVWPARFTRASAASLAGDPMGIANVVYADRLGNGPAASGDGWRYRGRGIFQLTGRANYRRYGEMIGIDLEESPGRAAEPGIALRVAAAYWTDRGLNAPADADDIEAVTRRLNGGLNGLADRRRWLARAEAVWA